MICRLWDVTLTVADLKRAVSFYEDVLGLSKKYEYKDYAGFDCGGVEIGLKTWGERATPRAGEPCLDFLVDDVNAEYRRLKGAGVAALREPMDTAWGSRIVSFHDPDGNSLQLVQVDWKKYFVAATK